MYGRQLRDQGVIAKCRCIHQASPSGEATNWIKKIMRTNLAVCCEPKNLAVFCELSVGQSVGRLQRPHQDSYVVTSGAKSASEQTSQSVANQTVTERPCRFSARVNECKIWISRPEVVENWQFTNYCGPQSRPRPSQACYTTWTPIDLVDGAGLSKYISSAVGLPIAFYAQRHA